MRNLILTGLAVVLMAGFAQATVWYETFESSTDKHPKTVSTYASAWDNVQTSYVTDPKTQGNKSMKITAEKTESSAAGAIVVAIDLEDSFNMEGTDTRCELRTENGNIYNWDVLFFDSAGYFEKFSYTPAADGTWLNSRSVQGSGSATGGYDYSDVTDITIYAWVGKTTATDVEIYLDGCWSNDPVPEPATLGILAMGGAALVVRRRRKKLA